MPHAVYLHSELTTQRQPADEHDRRRLLRGERLDVTIALGIAGVVNMAMLAVAAKLFHNGPGREVTLAAVHSDLVRQVGGTAALAFAVALLASGMSSSTVGTYAGQVVMQGFTDLRVKQWVRRAMTMAPAIIVVAIGADPMRALVLSQVVLGFGIPFALVPLVVVSANREVMGPYAASRRCTAIIVGVTVAIVALDGYALVQFV